MCHINYEYDISFLYHSQYDKIVKFKQYKATFNKDMFAMPLKVFQLILFYPRHITKENVVCVDKMQTSRMDVWFDTHIPPVFGLYSGLWIVIIPEIERDIILNAIREPWLFAQRFMWPFGKKPIKYVTIIRYST